jgi:hypothetical protein
MEVDEGWGDEKRFIDMRAYAAWKKEKGSRT